jgi:hypothetical protein
LLRSFPEDTLPQVLVAVLQAHRTASTVTVTAMGRVLFCTAVLMLQIPVGPAPPSVPKPISDVAPYQLITTAHKPSEGPRHEHHKAVTQTAEQQQQQQEPEPYTAAFNSKNLPFEEFSVLSSVASTLSAGSLFLFCC